MSVPCGRTGCAGMAHTWGHRDIQTPVCRCLYAHTCRDTDTGTRCTQTDRQTHGEDTALGRAAQGMLGDRSLLVSSQNTALGEPPAPPPPSPRGPAHPTPPAPQAGPATAAGPPCGARGAFAPCQLLATSLLGLAQRMSGHRDGRCQVPRGKGAGTGYPPRGPLVSGTPVLGEGRRAGTAGLATPRCHLVTPELGGADPSPPPGMLLEGSFVLPHELEVLAPPRGTSPGRGFHVGWHLGWAPWGWTLRKRVLRWAGAA